jgi:site-specific DNA-methyltransferase (adenine-specific)
MKLTDRIEIINIDNIEYMSTCNNNFFDLILTSPPYDNLRKYDSNINDNIYSEFFRILKDDGYLCWNVFDEKIQNSYSCSSLKQVLKFIDAGFNLHQYLIYEKNSVAFNAKKSGNLYTNIFEFVFVFSKQNPKQVNLICDKKNKYAGQSSYDGKIKKVSEFSPRTNIWKYATSLNDKTSHPAVMPEKLVKDLIHSYSNENDIVFDPYGGSGTTMKMCHNLKRNGVSCEINKEYFNESIKRVNNYTLQEKLF